MNAPLTTEDFATIATSRRAWADYVVRGADAQGWAWFEAWARGMPLSWRQYQRVALVLARLFEASAATAMEQTAAAHSWDDEGDGRGVRGGAGGDCWRLLVRARLLIGRGVGG